MLRLFPIILTFLLFSQSSIAQKEDTIEINSSQEIAIESDSSRQARMLQYIESLPCKERIPIYKEMNEKSTDSLERNELQYKIAACYMNMGSYNHAYAAAKNVTGELKTKALKIQAQCVAATANSCGNSTFERKCNYVYVAQLMEEAGLDGSKYRAMGPDGGLSSCIRTTKVFLPCWGVEVIVCE